MFIAKVTGSLVATQKVPEMIGRSLFIVDPLKLDEKSAKLVSTGRCFIAVDTVGAGDVFMAAFLAQALDAGALQVPTDMDASRARALLDYANAAAALCCMRAGAEAPTRAEVETFIAASPLRGKSD